ncbi:MAG TPA: inositol monophosphatase family protein [Bacillaceae bacterium]
MTNWAEIDRLAKSWLKEAGERIISSFSTALDIQTKSDANDLVTNIDRDIEQFFIGKIRESLPGHRILGEEGFGDELKDLAGIVWIIDPIDGTMNFIHQQRNFMISIGVYEDGQGKLGYIYDVVHDELYHAQAGKGAYLGDDKLPRLEKTKPETALIGMNSTWLTSNRYMDPSETLIPLANKVRGTRSYGSAALELAYVATGALDAYITMRLSPWDFAGGKVIVEELGGIVTNLKGEPLDMMGTNSVLAAKPGLHEAIIKDFLNKGEK